MSYRRHSSSKKFRIAPELEVALFMSPLILGAGIAGLFIRGDFRIAFFLLRFLLYVLVGYLAASRLHSRWSSRASRKIFNQMVPTGLRSGLYAGLIAWALIVAFLGVATMMDLWMSLTLLNGFLMGLVDVVLGLLFGSLGGWIYSKSNQPRIMRR